MSCITLTEGSLDGEIISAWDVSVSNEDRTTVFLNEGESFQVDLFSPYQDLSQEFNSQVQSFIIESDQVSPTLYGELTNLTWLIGGSQNCANSFVPPKPAISKERIIFSDNSTGYVTAVGPANPEINQFCSYILRIGNVLFPNLVEDAVGQYTISIHSAASGDPEVNRLDIPSRLIIDSAATFGRSFQTVQVRTPIRPPLSGLYDFVLFSAEEIVK